MAEKIAEVPIDILFTIQNLDQPAEKWKFYVNFRLPDGEDKSLADALYGNRYPSLPLLDFPSVMPFAQILVEEIRSYVPPKPTVKIGEVELPMTGGMTAISHNIRWATFDTTNINWVREYKLANGKEYRAVPSSGHVSIASLSTASRAAIRHIDGTTTDVAYARFAELVKKAAMIPADVELLPKKRDVFIAYRKPHAAAAEALHARMLKYGNGAIFRPYLDKHDLKLGDLRKRLKEQIESTSLFVPLVTSDYAADGTISQDELQFAKDAAGSKGGIERFFAPIFLGGPKTNVSAELKDLVRLSISNHEEIAKGSTEMDDFFRMCAIPY